MVSNRPTKPCYGLGLRDHVSHHLPARRKPGSDEVDRQLCGGHAGSSRRGRDKNCLLERLGKEVTLPTFRKASMTTSRTSSRNAQLSRYALPVSPRPVGTGRAQSTALLGFPDIVVPIGDVPYDSKITHKVEYLPVVANVVGAPGTDFQLLQAVEKVLKLAKRPTSVATGSRMFPSSKR